MIIKYLKTILQIQKICVLSAFLILAGCSGVQGNNALEGAVNNKINSVLNSQKIETNEINTITGFLNQNYTNESLSQKISNDIEVLKAELASISNSIDIDSFIEGLQAALEDEANNNDDEKGGDNDDDRISIEKTLEINLSQVKNINEVSSKIIDSAQTLPKEIKDQLIDDNKKESNLLKDSFDKDYSKDPLTTVWKTKDGRYVKRFSYKKT